MNEMIIATFLGRIFALYLFTTNKENTINLPANLTANDLPQISFNDLYATIKNIEDPKYPDVRQKNRLKLIIDDTKAPSDFSFLAFSLTKVLLDPKFIKELNVELNNIKNSLLLENYRHEEKLSVKELAEILNVNHRNISAWENHKRNFNGKILTKLDIKK